MSKRKNDAEMRESMSDDEVARAVVEFVQRMDAVESELEGLKEDRKDLIDEFSDKLDMKTLRQVLRIMKIRREIAHKDTFDTYEKALEERDANG